MEFKLNKKRFEMFLTEDVVSDEGNVENQVVDNDNATVTKNNNGTSQIKIGTEMVNQGKNAVKDIVKNAVKKFGCNINNSSVVFSDDINNTDDKIPVNVTANDINKGKSYLDRLKNNFATDTGVSNNKLNLSVNTQTMMMSECVKLKKGKIREMVLENMSTHHKKSDLV